jgi:hypothetical protein
MNINIFFLLSAQRQNEDFMRKTSEFLNENRSAMIDYILAVSTLTRNDDNFTISAHHDHLDILMSLRERRKRKPALESESVPVLPHQLDVPRHLAIIVSATIRKHRAHTDSESGSDESVGEFTSRCMEVEEQALRRVSQLATSIIGQHEETVHNPAPVSTDRLSVPSALRPRAASDPLSTRSGSSPNIITQSFEALAIDVAAQDPLSQHSDLAPDSFSIPRNPAEDSWDQRSMLSTISSMAPSSIESHQFPDPNSMLPPTSSDASTSRISAEDTLDRRSMLSTMSSIYSMATPSIESYDLNTPLALVVPLSGLSISGCTQEQLQTFQRHRSLWKNLDTLKSVTWDCFPWPVFHPLVTPEDLKQDDVAVYLQLLHPFEEDKYPTAEEHVKEHVRRWHPDRLEAKVLDRVVENDKEKVQVWTNKVAVILAMISLCA